jgi:hypothetical protein
MLQLGEKIMKTAKQESPENFVLLTEKEAAIKLGLKPQTLSVWRVRGTGPAHTLIGRCVRYRQDILDAYIFQNTMPR